MTASESNSACVWMADNERTGDAADNATVIAHSSDINVVDIHIRPVRFIKFFIALPVLLQKRAILPNHHRADVLSSNYLGSRVGRGGHAIWLRGRMPCHSFRFVVAALAERDLARRLAKNGRTQADNENSRPPFQSRQHVENSATHQGARPS